jgi:RimJ/RimL family protein N-acetyltransferase
MYLTGYGVKLTKLKEEDIELVRYWRNSAAIQQYMEYREEITKKKQLKWFSSINNIHHNYFIIEVNNKKIGLIYGGGIDWNKLETGNGGIFIWDPKYWNTKNSLGATLLLIDTSQLLGLKRTYIKVLSTNKNAIFFNKSLGYKLLSNQEDVLNQRYVLENNDYIYARNKLRSKIFEPSEYEPVHIHFKSGNEVNTHLLNQIKKTSESVKKHYKIYSYE